MTPAQFERQQAYNPNSPMKFNRDHHSNAFLLDLYKKIRYPRMIEEKMLIQLRQGKISKWFSGIGQEAIAVGLSAALDKRDYILPLHRNLGVFTTRDLPLHRLAAQWLGKPMGYTQGRDRSFHFGDEESRIIGMISHLGAMLPVANGLALASKLDKSDFIAVPFMGDGGTSEGDFHEALNVASVWDLPVLFVVENNGYGLSTPSREQFRCEYLADRAIGYGMDGYSIDGNNILEVYAAAKQIGEQVRKNQRPALLECMTFRMRGHEEASGTKYVPQELFDEWEKKDPVENFAQFLKDEGILTEEEDANIKSDLKQKINDELNIAHSAELVNPQLEKEVHAVFAELKEKGDKPSPSSMREMRFVDAISDALNIAMQRDEKLVLMGQDIAEYGGVFKITQGFVEKYGKDRVRNTPICESVIAGMGLGLSLAGRASMVEMQFSDFVSCAFNQIVNNLAKNHYRWGHAPKTVIRMPAGGGMGAGPFHSQTSEAWFTHTPGLKVVYPASPADAKGLLLAALDDPNPVVFFEHKYLYRSLSEEVPEGHYHIPIGSANIVRSGEDLTIITYGLGVIWAQEVCQEIEDIDAEIVDLRSLIPWDRETVMASVQRTGKCIVLYEANQTGGFGGEIAAEIGQHCFEYLDGPVMRLGSLDTPIPFQPALEKQFQAKARLKEALIELAGY